jgi:hypothetical protein
MRLKYGNSGYYDCRFKIFQSQFRIQIKLFVTGSIRILKIRRLESLRMSEKIANKHGVREILFKNTSILTFVIILLINFGLITSNGSVIFEKKTLTNLGDQTGYFKVAKNLIDLNAIKTPYTLGYPLLMIPLILLLCGFFYIVFYLSYWWSANSDLIDRFLMPAYFLYIYHLGSSNLMPRHGYSKLILEKLEFLNYSFLKNDSIKLNEYRSNRR